MDVHAEMDVKDTLISDYVYVMDYDNDQILMDKNGEEKIYPASMTKIMTSLIALEHLPDVNQKVTITADMLDGLAEMNASVAGFQIGDMPTVLDLVYGCALPSGADAANALAYTVAGSIPDFIKMMNQKAADLGLSHTHFANPTGLHDDDHYSTSKEIAELLRAAIENDTFVQIFSASSYTTTALSSAGNSLTFSSTTRNNASLYQYDIPEMIGAKSGFTYEAGHCLASWETVNDMHIITVTAHANTDMDEPSQLEDLVTILSDLRTFQKKMVTDSQSSIKEIELQNLFDDSMYEVFLPQSLQIDTRSEDEVTYVTDLPNQIALTNTEQTIPYVFQVYVNGTLLKQEQYTCTIPADSNHWTRMLRTLIQLFE